MSPWHSRMGGQGAYCMFMAPDVSEDQARGWLEDLAQLHEQLKPYFPSRSAWSVAGGYLVGLLSAAERKNSWQMAEETGQAAPTAFQHLLNQAVWDVDGVRDAVAAYVYEHLGVPGGVLVLDETGFLKKGKASVGVQRQYSGTAGKTENCQIGVFLAYASERGAALVDCALYLPESWASDAERRKKTHIPPSVQFATKSILARQMLERAFAAGLKASWVTADEEYGKSSELRAWLEAQQQSYVLAVAGNVGAWRDSSKRALLVPEVAASVRPDQWRKLSAGAGEKGERWYEWARVLCPTPAPVGWSRWVLLRRSLEDGELAYYLAAGPESASLEELVRVAGMRWHIEVCFEQAKGEVGLDQYEVRSWHGWHRHITLSMAALAFLAVMRHRAMPPPPKGGSASGEASPMAEFKAQRAREDALLKAKRQFLSFA